MARKGGVVVSRERNTSCRRIEAAIPEPERLPLRTVLDLELGVPVEAVLSDGETVRVEALEVDERVGALRSAIRNARVRARVNAVETWIDSANYNLPRQIAGVQVDCPITKGYRDKAHRRVWGLEKALRLRLWPGDSALIRPESLVYPVRQRWFATDTQMSNEPCYVGGAEGGSPDSVYYHNGLDIGGAEGLVDVVSATDGTILAVGHDVVSNHDAFYGTPCPDQVSVLDERGWVHLYAHLKDIERDLHPGNRIARGRKIALLGKEGSSGGWAHLHYGIFSVQPSGQWGTEEGYAYLLDAYRRQYAPPLLAVARPHHFLKTGQRTVLDGTRSWCRDEQGIRGYEWRFTDGSTASGPQVERTYAEAGLYSETLEVTDRHGNFDRDFAVVQVVDDYDLRCWPPGLHAAYAPSLGLRPGDPVTFLVRSFQTGTGSAVWDLGDGTPEVALRSDGNLPKHDPAAYAWTTHVYDSPGQYVASVVRKGDDGTLAVARVHVEIGSDGL